MAASNANDTGGFQFMIFHQILITMVVIALIPLGGLWYISIYKSNQEWNANIFQTLRTNTEALADRVDDWTSMNMSVLEQNADVPNMVSMDSSLQNPVLKTITSTYQYIYLAFTIQPDGMNVGRSDGKPVKFYGDRDYFKQVMGGQEVGKQLVIGKTSKKLTYILSRWIVSEKRQTIGLLGIAMTLEDLSATVTKTGIGETGFAILVDENNRLMAHGRGEIASELQDRYDHPVFNATRIIDRNNFVFEENGKKIVAYRHQTRFGWNLIIQQDYDEAYAVAKKAQMNTLILFAVTLLIVIVVAYLLAQRLSTPIQNLTAIANKISLGLGATTIHGTKRSDEIGALARSIERMGLSLQMAFDRLRKK